MDRTESPASWLPLGRTAATLLGAIVSTLGAPPTSPGGAAPPRPAARQGEAPPSSEGKAREAFLARRHADAHGRYAELADEGDAPSAWMALLMVKIGRVLFGSQWSAMAGQLQRWRALATRHADQRLVSIPLHDLG